MVKVDLIFNDIIVDNFNLPESFYEFIINIGNEFSLKENEIDNFLILAELENDIFEVIDSEEKYSQIKKETIKKIRISEKNFNHKLFSEKATSFENKAEKVIEEQLLIAAKNIKVLLSDYSVDEKKKNNFNKVNRILHLGLNCSECNQENIVGYYYICNIENNVILCNKCVEKHEHPCFKML